jgi:hypothetical protein
MSVINKVLAGGAVAAALASGAPASAQYYPGSGYPSPYGYRYGGNPVGQIPGQVPGGAYGYPGAGYGYGSGYGVNSQAVVSQCVGAVQARLGGGYGGYSPYGYASGAAGGRVLGISHVDPRPGGGVRVRGVASSGRFGAGYGVQAQPDLTFKCATDYRGFITSVEVTPAVTGYGYAPNNGYTPYDYSQYGYRRY